MLLYNKKISGKDLEIGMLLITQNQTVYAVYKCIAPGSLEIVWCIDTIQIGLTCEYSATGFHPDSQLPNPELFQITSEQFEIIKLSSQKTAV